MSLENFLPTLLDLFLKSAAVLLLAFAVNVVFRRASAANRHAIWFAALLVLLLLPLTKFGNPRWTYAWTRTKPAAPIVAHAAVVRVALASPVSEATSQTATPAIARTVAVNWAAIGVFVSLFGTFAVVLHRTVAGWRLARLAGRSRPLALERWRHLLGDVPAGVEIRESAECRVPLAAGLFQSLVLLPTVSLDWSDERLAAALNHEFGHIRRRDCLTRLLLDLACAIHWMNPLMWMAARSMRVAQEQACDDLVLGSGANATDYASQLVEVARSLGQDRLATRYALAMAQPSTLETRVRAIVDAGRDRRPVTRAVVLGGWAAVVTVLALCSGAQLQGADEKKPSPEAAPAQPGPLANAPMVTIEAKFVEFTEGKEGPDAALPDFFKSLGLGIVGMLQGVLTDPEFQVIIRKLTQQKGVDLLASPRATTKSGQRMVIEIIREFRYPTEYDKDPKSGKLTQKNFESKNIGVTLTAEPLLQPDGTLELTLAPEVVEFMGYNDYTAGDPKLVGEPESGKPLGERLNAAILAKVPEGHIAQPVFRTRKLNTSVTVFPGQTVVLECGTSDEAKDEPKEPRRRLLVFITASLVEPEPQGQAAAKPAPAGGAAGSPLVVTSNEATDDAARGTLTASGEVKVETAEATILSQNVEVHPKNTATAAAKSEMMERAEKIILPKIEFRDATVREAGVFFTRKSRELDPEQKGVNVVVNLPETDTTRITMSLENIPLPEALKYLADLAGLRIEIGADGYLLQGAGKSGGMREPAAGSPEAALLNRARGIVIPLVELKDATVEEGAEFLRQKSAEFDLEKKPVNIVVRHSPVSANARITMRLETIPVAEALRYLAELGGLQLEVGPNAFVLRPADKE